MYGIGQIWMTQIALRGAVAGVLANVCQEVSRFQGRETVTGGYVDIACHQMYKKRLEERVAVRRIRGGILQLQSIVMSREPIISGGGCRQRPRDFLKTNYYWMELG